MGRTVGCRLPERLRRRDRPELSALTRGSSTLRDSLVLLPERCLHLRRALPSLQRLARPARRRGRMRPRAPHQRAALEQQDTARTARPHHRRQLDLARHDPGGGAGARPPAEDGQQACGGRRWGRHRNPGESGTACGRRGRSLRQPRGRPRTEDRRNRIGGNRWADGARRRPPADRTQDPRTAVRLSASGPAHLSDHRTAVRTSIPRCAKTGPNPEWSLDSDRFQRYAPRESSLC
jgi:hypothetical protein